MTTQRAVPAKANIDKKNYVEIIGKTPLVSNTGIALGRTLMALQVDLSPLSPELSAKGITLLGKCEFLNPSGSIKV